MVLQGLWGLKPPSILWAHRLTPYLSTSFLSWLKHQLPPEIPAPSLAHPPGELPSGLLLQQPVFSPRHYQ